MRFLKYHVVVWKMVCRRERLEAVDCAPREDCEDSDESNGFEKSRNSKTVGPTNRT